MTDLATQAVRLTELEYKFEKLKYLLLAGEYGDANTKLQIGREEKN